jgi:dimethylargininase
MGAGPSSSWLSNREKPASKKIPRPARAATKTPARHSTMLIAITHPPSPRLQDCQRTYVARRRIDFDLARKQHNDYCGALRDCGAEVRTLEVNRNLPDGTFIEDTALVLDELAVVASMGADSRRAEPAAIEPELRRYRKQICRIEPPATLEGGDVLRVGRTLLVGLSSRTNAGGVAALGKIIEPFGYKVISVPVRRSLHLKTACTALPDHRLLINPAWLETQALAGFDLVPVPAAEPWAANVALIGSTVFAAASHFRTAEMIRNFGFAVRPIDISEFAKAEGGVTCLSILFESGK